MWRTKQPDTQMCHDSSDGFARQAMALGLEQQLSQALHTLYRVVAVKKNLALNSSCTSPVALSIHPYA
jgi:hypothetical protein